jgi:hypothetical protein
MLQASPKSEWNGLSDTQKRIITEDYHYGKQFNAGYTLAAINWHESQGCKYQIGELTGDFGCYQMNLKYFLIRNEVDNNYYNRNMYATKFIADRLWARQLALNEIIYWNKQAKSWYKTWAMYNGGFNPQYDYADEILAKVLFLKTIMEK